MRFIAVSASIHRLTDEYAYRHSHDTMPGRLKSPRPRVWDFMAEIIDPDGNETRVIHDLIDFAGKDVVEIGCGDGRMTWRYASVTASVLGIDPDESEISDAKAATPRELSDRVTFRAADVCTVKLAEDSFDVAVLAWSL